MMVSIRRTLPPFPSLYYSSTTHHHYPTTIFRRDFVKLLHTSKMSNNGGTGKNSEPSGHQINPFNFNAQQSASPTSVPFFQFTSPTLPPNTHFSQVHQILNTAAPKRPFSYMSLLTAPDKDQDNVEPLFQDINNQRAQIDHIVSLHTQNLKQALNGALGQHLQDVHHEAEERGTKRQKARESELLAQNAQLQSMADHYKALAERMVIRVRTLERTTRTLNERLDEANAARFYAEAAQEEAESSFTDPDRVEPIRLECKVCQRKRATMMMLPCRHVCVCTFCDGTTTYCPVCLVVNTNSVQVNLPLN